LTLFQKAVGRLLGEPEIEFPLETVLPETRVLESSELMRLSLCQGGGKPLTRSVAVDDSVTAGQVLATGAGGFVLASPVTGTVKAITDQPDIRGCRIGDEAILVEPEPEAASSAFEPLDPENADAESLAKRVVEAGILSAMRAPVPLLSLLRPDSERQVDIDIDTVVILAADRDPGVSVALQLLRERSADTCAAARLLGRIAGAGRVVLALPEGDAASFAAVDGVELLAVPERYPETLAGAILRRLGVHGDIPVISLEAALAALDAVRKGEVQREKLLTLIGPDQKPIANYRVQLGTPIRDILAHAGLEAGERDKVIAGGVMRGFAVYSLDGCIDAGVDALTVIPDEHFPSWSTEPCINCGRCIDICPINLQVQLIARYAEFELFDSTRELDIDQCFECGLCAAVCTGRRPLLQYIRLAKEGLEVSV
jgi:Na+-translocating ferredoxin:NAD+ oxidoreductase subunit C